jgi:putative cardiolipin synthase
MTCNCLHAIVGAVVPQLTRIFDTYWNSPQVYPAESIIGTTLDRQGLQRQFNALVDEGEQMMSVAPPPIDVLGYGPISDDLEQGAWAWCGARPTHTPTRPPR